MLRSKTTVFGLVFALVLMTGLFTALSSDGANQAATAADIDEFALINGEEVTELDFISRLASVEQNVFMLQAQAASADGSSGQAAEILEVLESTAPETIALASLIMDTAIYQEALARGYMPSQSMVDEQVQQERQIFEMIEQNPAQFGADEADVASYRERIDQIGEERYWNEFFPQAVEQQMMVQVLQVTSGQAGEDWIELQRTAFLNAEVQIGDPDGIAPATIEDAETYMQRIWEIYLGG